MSSRLIRPATPHALTGATDPRSTGAPPPTRVKDIQALRGTKPS